MTTQQLTLLQGPWTRPYDRRETPCWLAATAAPLAWLAHLVGAAAVPMLLVIAVAGMIAAAQLRRLYAQGDRSGQRVWFLAQLGVTLAVVCSALVLVT